MNIFKVFKKDKADVKETINLEFTKGEFTPYTELKDGLFIYDDIIWFKSPGRGAVSLKCCTSFFNYIKVKNKEAGKKTTLPAEVGKVVVQQLK